MTNPTSRQIRGDEESTVAAAVRALGIGGTVAVVGDALADLELATELATSRPELQVRLVSAGPLGDRVAALERVGVDVIERARVRRIEHGRVLLEGDWELRADVAVVGGR
jgi:NADH:ubiquinone reductase (H+-translocating)